MRSGFTLNPVNPVLNMGRGEQMNPFMRLVGRVRTGFTLDPVNPVLNNGRGEQMNPFMRLQWGG